MTAGNTIAETSSTGYYIWAIASGSTSTFECGINQTASNMTGNANSRMIGWFWNGTANTIEGVWWKDANNNRHFRTPWYSTTTGNTYVFHHGLESMEFISRTWVAPNVSGTGASEVGVHETTTSTKSELMLDNSSTTYYVGKFARVKTQTNTMTAVVASKIFLDEVG
jgi:hypothetical protein